MRQDLHIPFISTQPSEIYYLITACKISNGIRLCHYHCLSDGLFNVMWAIFQLCHVSYKLFWWGYPFCTRPTQWVVLSNASSLIQCISILTHYPDWHFVNIQDSILNMVVFYHYIVTTCYWGRKTWTQKPVGQQVAQQMTSKSIR